MMVMKRLAQQFVHDDVEMPMLEKPEEPDFTVEASGRDRSKVLHYSYN